MSRFLGHDFCDKKSPKHEGPSVMSMDLKQGWNIVCLVAPLARRSIQGHEKEIEPPNSDDEPTDGSVTGMDS